MGWTAGLAGVLSVAIGVDVGYSGTQRIAVPAFQVVMLVFGSGSSWLLPGGG